MKCFQSVKSSEDGLAILEMGVFVMALFLFLLGGFIASQRYNHFSLAKRLVSKLVHDDSLRPLHMVQNSGVFEIQVDAVALDALVTQKVGEASGEIQSIINQFNLAGAFSVEMAYRVVNINPSDGSVQQVGPPQCFVQTDAGFSSGGSCTDIDVVLFPYASQATSTGRSVYAIPSAYLGRQVGGQGAQELNQYLPSAVVLGMRVSWSVREANGGFVPTFGLPQEAFDQQVTVLRGELAL